MLAGVLTTHACVGRPTGGDWEYVLWSVGTGWLR
jgi:hypothetical protein